MKYNPKIGIPILVGSIVADVYFKCNAYLFVGALLLILAWTLEGGIE